MTIEEVLEITNRIENIDGDNVYVLDREMHKGIWKLRRRGEREKENYMFSMLNKDIEFMCNHAGFAIAFRHVKSKMAKKRIPCLIYK